MNKQDKHITVKEVLLKNNCPECYSNDGLQLTFKQRFIETTFYKSITNDIKHILFCRAFPVDIRHNAKINRETLTIWAKKQLKD